MVHPLVSVCIPTYNGEKFLLQALESVQHQTYENIEIVVSDDNSIDRTLQIVAEFENRVRIPVQVYSHKPSGIGANWNHCIRKANGSFIKFLFQDDILAPECIEKQVGVLLGQKEIGLVSCKRSILKEKDISNVNWWIRKYSDLQRTMDLGDSEILLMDKSALGKDIFHAEPINKIGEPSTVMFPTSIVKKVGYFREDMIQILDYEFYYRILKYKKIAIINEKLVQFRLHREQATNQNKLKKNLDAEIYDEVLFKQFFFYLSKREQKRLLKKFMPGLYKILKILRNG